MMAAQSGDAAASEQAGLLHLRAQNEAAWLGESIFKTQNALDSSLKKNTAFIKKARLSLSAENLSSLISDVESLSLEKYLSEVVSAVAEGLSRAKVGSDIQAAVQVVSALHQRFTIQFTPFLAFNLVKGLAPPPASYLNGLSAEQREKEEGNRVVRQRILLRAVTELWLSKVFRSVQDAIDGSSSEARKKKNDEALPIFCLRELLANDRDFSNLAIPVSFIKNFSWLLPYQNPSPMLIDPQESQSIYLILQKYFELLKAHLVKQNSTILRELQRLEENSLVHGSISGTREAGVNDLQKLHEKQLAGAQTLADNLQLDMPDLKPTDDNFESSSSIIRGVGNLKLGDETDSIAGIWEDEEQRRFYEVLVDLKEVVPSDLLTDGKMQSEMKVGSPKPPDNETTTASTTTDIESEHTFDDTDLDDELHAHEEDIEPTTTTIGARLGALLLKLPDSNNRELVDNAAVEFAFLNSKASRNRLIKTLLDIPSSRTDILPYYARFLATLDKYLPTITEKVVEHLHRDCRRFVRGRGLSKDVPMRNCNIRYISELVKFKVIPQHITFHCLRILTETFTRNDIEVLATLLENCGRFLLKSPETSHKMQDALEIISRKAKNLSGMERSVIENAFYYVNPPERTVIPQKERLPVELYIRKLIFKELNAKNYDRILRQLKKIDWNGGDGDLYLTQIFTKVWKVKFASIQYMAILLSGLAKVHLSFVINVIDSVVENIRTGLENNLFRDNQKRLSSIKYLGELYNYKQIDTSLIFDTLYLLLTFGHPGGRPMPGGSQYDTSRDFFRIRLVLTLLDTCGNCFNKGPAKTKLDLFLAFLQYYVRTKEDVPLDIEFGVADTFTHLRPNLVILTDLESASKELDEAVKLSTELHTNTNDAEQDLDSDENLDDGDEISERVARARENDGEDSDEQQSQHDGDDEQFVLLEKKRLQDDLDKEAEDELSREFAKVMSESSEGRKQERSRPLDIALPRRTPGHVLPDQPQKSTPASVSLDKGSPNQASAVSFTFLSKKGKPRSLNLPSDSALVLSNTAQRAAEQEEKQAIKNLVIKYETEYGREDVDEAANKAGIAIRYTPQMLAGQRGGQRNGSMFRMGTQRQQRNPDT